MKNKEQEDFEKAKDDILDIMEMWASESRNVRPMMAAGLSVFIQACLDMSPCRHDVIRLLGDAMKLAADISEENSGGCQ